MEENILKDGTKVYLVHNQILSGESKTGRIVIAKIKTYQRTLRGELLPVCVEVGNTKGELRIGNNKTEGYALFTSISDAVNAMQV